MNHTLNPKCVAGLLAQLPAPEAAQFRDWLVSGAAALALACLGKQFLRKPPLEAEFLSRADFQVFQDKLDRSLKALTEKLDALHNRLHEVRSLVDRVDERTQHLRRTDHE